ncbi:MAG: hypothetical protein B7Z15_10520, partial [Rhizobiales bacterium 32-66-8]
MTEFSAEEIRDLLAFHLEAGVDVALGDEPVDRFAETAAALALRPAPAGGARGAGQAAPGAQAA